MNQDLIDRVGAVRREVRACDHDGQPARAIVAERAYDATVADVWDAITSAERIPRWFAPVSGELRLGGRFQIEGNASGDITACDPPEHLALTWEFAGQTSWVDVRLRESADGVVLRLEHVALVADIEAMAAQMGDFGPGALGVGWDLALLGLDEHLRTGEAARTEPWEAPAGDAAEFIRRCAVGWGEADIAAGTPEYEARARAERVAAFYTGADPAAAHGGEADGGAPAEAHGAETARASGDDRAAGAAGGGRGDGEGAPAG
ncbi:MAG TPA: SRPBCC family protein [Acidimicrobiales bacterium]